MMRNRFSVYAVSALMMAAGANAALGQDRSEARQVELKVAAASTGHRISPLVYGINRDGFLGGATKGEFTAIRLGGNAVSTYNWENNFNNAGHDNHNSNGAWVARYVPADQMDQPAAAIKQFKREADDLGAKQTLVQLPDVGWVAADDDSTVTEAQAAPSSRWKKVVPIKGAPFADKPDPDDDVVYVDEMIHELVKTFGPADKGGITAYAVANEPAIWYKTHARAQLTKPKARELVQRSIALAKAVKSVDPTALVYGPSLLQSWGYTTFRDAEDWPKIKKAGGYRWFVDYYLDAMHKASEKAGIRLLDVLDIHPYVSGQVFDRGGPNAVLNQPRTLWQEGYRDPSWIGELFYPQSFPILPRIQASIDEYFPGTKIACTEYSASQRDKPYGSMALAETLGVFGREGVYAAYLWSHVKRRLEDFDELSIPSLAAFNLYRNYDGEQGRFGDVSVAVHNPAIDRLSSYAAFDRDGRLHLILISKQWDRSIPLRVQLPGSFTSAEAYGYDDDSYKIHKMDQPSVNHGVLTMALPKSTALHVVLTP